MPVFPLIKPAAFMVSALLLTACSPAPHDQPQSQTVAQLTAANWQLSTLNAQSFEGQAPTLAFNVETNRVSGFSGCNRYMGGFSADDQTLSFTQLASTMMACPDPAMQLEQQFIEVLQQAHQWGLTDKVLTLSDQDGKALATFGIQVDASE